MQAVPGNMPVKFKVRTVAVTVLKLLVILTSAGRRTAI